MSWLSSHMTNGRADSPIMFETLKALVIGLGSGACDEMFACDLKSLVHARKLARQKRSTKGT